jgi:hypothetical protein
MSNLPFQGVFSEKFLYLFADPANNTFPDFATGRKDTCFFQAIDGRRGEADDGFQHGTTDEKGEGRGTLNGASSHVFSIGEWLTMGTPYGRERFLRKGKLGIEKRET